MSKLFLFVFFLSFSITGVSQEYDINRISCAQKFSQKMHHIMDKVHELVLTGKVIAYNTDSFHLTFSVNDYKDLNRHRKYDSTHPACSKYNTLGFIEQTKLNYNSSVNTTKLIGICLFDNYLLSPGMELPMCPMFYVKTKDIAKFFTKNEMNWLYALQSISGNIPYSVDFRVADTIINYGIDDSALIKSKWIYLSSRPELYNLFMRISINRRHKSIDTLIFTTIYKELLTSYYLRIFKLHPDATLSPGVPFYYDPLFKKKVDWSEFRSTYNKSMRIGIPDERFPDSFELFKDTLVERFITYDHFAISAINTKGNYAKFKTTLLTLPGEKPPVSPDIFIKLSDLKPRIPKNFYDLLLLMGSE